MFTIGIPGFLLALETNKNRIEGHFLKNVMLKALPAGLTDVLIVGSLTVCGKVFGIAENDIATAATMLLAVVGFMILEKSAIRSTNSRWQFMQSILQVLFYAASSFRICLRLPGCPGQASC